MARISDIKTEMQQLEHTMYDSFIDKYQGDERSGVRKIVEQVAKKKQDRLDELKRIKRMFILEDEIGGDYLIAGIDEAGRGPLAGPVVAAACILNKDDLILYVDDSKKLSHEKRERLYDEITTRSLAYGVGVVHQDDIDAMNILQATYKAMRLALEAMDIQPTHLLNDAVIIPEVSIPQSRIIHGDALSLSIAAASILAKVTRDRLMVAYDSLYPEYGFAKHKGYGSKAHIEAIKEYGPCALHRTSFIKNFV